MAICSRIENDKAYQYVNWSAAEDCESLEWDNISPPLAELPVMDESVFNATNFVSPYKLFTLLKTAITLQIQHVKVITIYAGQQ